MLTYGRICGVSPYKKNNINTALVEINVREYGTGNKKWRIQ
jgi:hypothetical protein